MRPQSTALLALCLIASCTAPISEPLQHRPVPLAVTIPTEGSCSELPRVNLEVATDHIRCVGLIDDQLAFPRGIATWKNDLLVADKGRNLHDRGPGRGTVYRYTGRDGLATRQRLLENLDGPSGIAVWRNRLAFVSTRGQVLRFDPAAPKPEPVVVIDHLPTSGWHDLTAVHIHNDWLYITVPSATDHCESGGAGQVRYPCPEVAATTAPELQTAIVRRYAIASNGQLEDGFRIFARGLRNALALASHPQRRVVYAADNGWDQVDLSGSAYTFATTPHDELNLIETDAGPHFGWPYCFDEGNVTPPYEAHKIDCAVFSEPGTLLPAHAAPSGMAWRNDGLWINLHGFRSAGRRTVRVVLDADGQPTGPLERMISWDYPDRPVFGVGRPFAIVNYDSDSLVISDDWNHALFRVFLRQ